MRLPRLRPDLTPLRESRDFRLVVVGSFLSGLGAQATLVALPYQVCESGAVADATSARFSVFSGGVLCVIGVAAIVVAFPALLRYDAEDWIAAPATSST